MPARKSTAQYEAEATWEGDCLVHSVKRGLARMLYVRRHGNLPSHLHVCHSCDRPACINDLHHFVGTHQDNMADAASKNRMHGGKPLAAARHHSKRLWQDSKYVEKTVANMLAAYTDEVRAARSESVKRIWADPNLRAARMRSHNTVAYKRVRQRAAKLAWKTRRENRNG